MIRLLRCSPPRQHSVQPTSDHGPPLRRAVVLRGEVMLNVDRRPHLTQQVLILLAEAISSGVEVPASLLVHLPHEGLLGKRQRHISHQDVFPLGSVITVKYVCGGESVCVWGGERNPINSIMKEMAWSLL